jgi:hypothetical protein
MLPRAFHVVVLVLFAPPLSLAAGTPRSGVDFTARQDRSFSQERFEKRPWGGGSGARLADRRFHITEWDKHYSSIGSKRAPIATGETREKKSFRFGTREFPRVDYERAPWNREMADLHRRAGLGPDGQTSRLAARRAYNEAIGDAQKYGSLGEAVSLRDINRYQFRRNRAEGPPPARKAGAGEGAP